MGYKPKYGGEEIFRVRKENYGYTNCAKSLPPVEKNEFFLIFFLLLFSVAALGFSGGGDL